MIIFPAIDIKNGQCVRLSQGKFDEMTVYYNDPVQVAKMWEKQGAKYIHVVDLDGAKDGTPKNIKVIKEIAKSVNIPVQVGGGIRTKKNVKDLLDIGAQRVILGTAAVNNISFIKEVLGDYGDKIVISIDASNGYVATNGWLKVSKVKSVDLVEKLQKMGVSTIVYTDISKDGMMQGPNFEIYSLLKDKCEVNIIASGGISKLNDIKKLRSMNIYGTIVGKALYTGAIRVEDMVQ